MRLQPEWHNSAAALGVMVKSVRASQVTVAMQHSLRAAESRPVTLPGFNLFSADKHSKAVEWLLPGVRADLDALISVYEAYADRRLGRVPAPDRVARQTLSPRHSQMVYGAPRSADQWWAPAAVIIAMASRRVATPLEYGPDWLSLELGKYRMELRYNAMWSNFHGRLVTTTATASDADITAFDVEPLTTSHPLAVAALEHGLPDSTLWAVNSLLRAEPGFKVLSMASQRIAASGLRARRSKRPARTRWDSWDSLRAYDELTALIDDGGPQAIEDLYKLAVPLTMTARDFTTLVGCPWTTPGRKVSQRVLQRLKEHLDSM